ncbi:MAG TPA: PDZ domain-containing protein [Candidatus Rubrimentiphilum sp.]|nr:PDZ domain-containing protein [Candidatus Rubrimentiphilum sp.]
MVRWSRVLVVVLACWATLVVGPDITRTFHDLGTLGFSADNNGEISSVDGPPASKAGLQPGDRIDLQGMRCNSALPDRETRCANLLAVFGGMGGLQYVLPGRDFTLWVKPLKNGHLLPAKTVHLRSVADPLSLLDRAVIILDWAAGIGFILLAATLVWRAPQLMTWGLFLYAMWFNSGPYFAYYAYLQQWPALLLTQEVLQAIAQALGYAGFVLFALRFPNNRTEAHWKWLERALPLLVIVLAGMQLVSFSTALGNQTEGIGRASYLAGYAVDLFVIFILVVRRWSLKPEEYQRIRWVIWGCLIGLPAFIFADSNEATTLWQQYLWGPYFNNWYPPEWLLGLLYFGNGLLGLAIFKAVRDRRVVNVSLPLRRGTAALLVAVVALIIIELVHLRVEGYVEERHLGYEVYAGLALILTVLFSKAYEFVVGIFERTFNRAFERAKEYLHEVGEMLIERSTRAEIERDLTIAPAESLKLTLAAVFRNHGTHYRRHTAPEGWSTAETVLDPQHDLIGPAIASGKAVRLPEDIPGETSMDGPRPVLAVPIKNRAHTFAVALYGAHIAGDDLDAQESAVLEDLAKEAAVAYEHVRSLTLERLVEMLKARLTKQKPIRET